MGAAQASQISLVKAFDASSLAAAAEGPKVRRPAARVASASRSHARKRISLGTRAFPKTRKLERITIRAKLSRQAWATLRRLHSIRVRVSVTLDGRTFSTRFTLQQPRPKRH